MAKFSRDKGIRGERQVSDLFNKAGFAAKRMVGQSQGGDNSPDVGLEDLPDYWIESKLGKKPNIRAALAQAEAAKRPRHKAIAVTREDGQKAIVSMSFDVFAELLRLAYPSAVIQPESPGTTNEERTTYLDDESPLPWGSDPLPSRAPRKGDL